MNCGNYNIEIMQGARLYREFKVDDFDFDDYEVKMEIRTNLYGDTILFLNDTQLKVKDKTTLVLDIGASVTRDFPVNNNAYYGIELIDKTDSENVISFLTGNFAIINEIPKEE